MAISAWASAKRCIIRPVWSPECDNFVCFVSVDISSGLSLKSSAFSRNCKILWGDSLFCPIGVVWEMATENRSEIIIKIFNNINFSAIFGGDFFGKTGDFSKVNSIDLVYNSSVERGCSG